MAQILNELYVERVSNKLNKNGHGLISFDSRTTPTAGKSGLGPADSGRWR
jgi:hypothetical protein